MSRMMADGLGLHIEHVADGHVDAEVDYMPPANPARPRLSPGRQVMIPARLWDAVLADVLADRDRARREFALLADVGTVGAVGAARVEQWRAMHPGFAALLDHPVGGA